MASSKVSPKDLAEPIVDVLNTIDTVADQITVIDGNTDSIKVTVENNNVKITELDTDIDAVSDQNVVIDENVDSIKVTVEDTNTKLDDIDTDIDNVDASVEDIKQTVASITEELSKVKSITTNVQRLVTSEGFGDGSGDATATEDQILSGATAYVQGTMLTGTMPDNGTVNPEALSAGGTYTIAKGYHSGEGKVVAKDLASQTEGTATAGKMLSGETAWVNGQKVTGNIEVHPGSQVDMKANGTYVVSKGYYTDPVTIKQNLNTLGIQIYEPSTEERKIPALTYCAGNQIIKPVTGTATADKVLSGETFNSSTGIGLTGAMPNIGSIKETIDAGNSYTIPEGYHDGTGKVTATPMSSQTDGTATAGQILTGQTAWVNGTKVTGTMPNIGSVAPSALSAGGSYTIPAGFHDGTGKVTAKDLASQTDGTATKAQILSGATAYVDGVKVTGEMVNNGAKTATLSAGGSYTIPAGYHNGSGVITAKDLASQTPGTAVSADVLKDKTAYVNGVAVTGTMPNNGAVTGTVNCGASYTIPKGYHDGTGKVTGNSLASQTSADAAAGNILLNKTAWVNGAKVTGSMPNNGSVKQTLPANGSYTIPAGYHDGTGKVTQSLTTQGAKTFSPSTTAGSIKAGTYLTGDITIAATTGTAVAANVLSGKTFNSAAGIGVSGTMKDNGAVSGTLNCGGSYTIPAGYHNGSGKVTANSLASQTSGNATAGQILTGQTAWVNGAQVTGTMKNNGSVKQTLAANGSYTIPAGYHDGTGKVTQSLTTQGAKTFNPSTSADSIKAGTYLTGDVTIAATTGTAERAHVLMGKTFNSAAGIGLTGLIADYSNTSNRWAGYGTVSVQRFNDTSQTSMVTIPNSNEYVGYYDNTSSVTTIIYNLYPDVIKKGVRVGRGPDNGADDTNTIVGTYDPVGSMYATGSVKVTSSGVKVPRGIIPNRCFMRGNYEGTIGWNNGLYDYNGRYEPWTSRVNGGNSVTGISIKGVDDTSITLVANDSDKYAPSTFMYVYQTSGVTHGTKTLTSGDTWEFPIKDYPIDQMVFQTNALGRTSEYMMRSVSTSRTGAVILEPAYSGYTFYVKITGFDETTGNVTMAFEGYTDTNNTNPASLTIYYTKIGS